MIIIQTIFIFNVSINYQLKSSINDMKIHISWKQTDFSYLLQKLKKKRDGIIIIMSIINKFIKNFLKYQNFSKSFYCYIIFGTRNRSKERLHPLWKTYYFIKLIYYSQNNGIIVTIHRYNSICLSWLYV